MSISANFGALKGKTTCCVLHRILEEEVETEVEGDFVVNIEGFVGRGTHASQMSLVSWEALLAGVLHLNCHLVLHFAKVSEQCLQAFIVPEHVPRSSTLPPRYSSSTR
jgi:hypothetical protein